MSPFLFKTRTLAIKSPMEEVFGHFFHGLLGGSYTSTASKHHFYNNVPQGGFFFMGTLVYDFPGFEPPVRTTVSKEESDAAMMKAIAIENAERAHVRAVRMEFLRQPSLLRRLLRGEYPSENAILRKYYAPKLNEEFLRTKFYKEFHMGNYDSMYFEAANIEPPKVEAANKK